MGIYGYIFKELSESNTALQVQYNIRKIIE